MKKTLKLSTALLMAFLFCFAFSACKEKTPENGNTKATNGLVTQTPQKSQAPQEPSTPSIVGTWKGDAGGTLTFGENNTLKLVQPDGETVNATYKVVGDEIIFNMPMGNEMVESTSTFTIEGNTLTIKSEGGNTVEVYTRKG